MTWAREGIQQEIRWRSLWRDCSIKQETWAVSQIRDTLFPISALGPCSKAVHYVGNRVLFQQPIKVVSSFRRLYSDSTDLP